MNNILLHKCLLKNKNNTIIKHNISHDKYILVKGLNGFGNMISTLSFCYNIALKTNRKIVIDWKNSLWNDEFEKYFNFKSNIFITFNDFIKNNKNNKNIYPKCFIDKLNYNFELLINQTNIKQLIEPLNYINSNIQIIVLSFNYHKIGFQYFTQFWNDIYLSNDIQNKINNYLNILQKYKSIHIRNTDQTQINNQWIINYLIQNKDYNIYVATDDINMIKFCKKYHTKIYNFTTFYNNEPLHFVKCENYYNKNIDTICDIYLLAHSDEIKFAEQITYNKIIHSSSYSILAQKIYDLKFNIDKDYNYVSFTPIKLSI